LQEGLTQTEEDNSGDPEYDTQMQPKPRVTKIVDKVGSMKSEKQRPETGGGDERNQLELQRRNQLRDSEEEAESVSLCFFNIIMRWVEGVENTFF
jgi:hypothetical protein